MRDRASARPGSRAVSIREEFPDAFHSLVHSAVGTNVDFRISAGHLCDRGEPSAVVATRARLVLVPAYGVVPGSFRIRLDGTVLPAFAADTSLGGLPVARCGLSAPAWVGNHVLSVVAAGGLDPATRAPGNVSALDPDKVEDLLLVLDLALESR
jgi:hypothetical protein